MSHIGFIKFVLSAVGGAAGTTALIGAALKALHMFQTKASIATVLKAVVSAKSMTR